MPIRRRKPRGTETAPNPPSDVPHRGVFARLTGSSSVSWHASNTDATMASVYVLWSQYQSAETTWNSTIENNVISSIVDADANNYRLLTRFMCGADGPIGRPGTSQASWMFSHATYPVSRVRTLNNETANADMEIFVPDWLNSWSFNATTNRYEPTPGSSAANYHYWYGNLMSHIAGVLNVNISAGNPRSNHVHLIPVAAPTEIGSEMTLGYGTNPTYTGAATLAAAVTAGATTFTLSGASGYPSSGLLKIKDNTGNTLRQFELVHYTANSGGTITVGKRGHSGTNAAAHAQGVTVQYASSGAITTTFNGYGPAPYDHGALNRTQWDAISTGSTAVDKENWRRDRTKWAWEYAIDQHMDLMPFSVHSGLAYGHLFNDAGARAKAIVQEKGPMYGHRLVGMVTSLKANYHVTNPNDDDFLHQAITSGCLIGAQTAGASSLAMGTQMVQAMEDALAHYVDANNNKVMHFIETYTTPFTSSTTYALSPYLGWTGTGNYTMKQYLLTDAAAIQGRLPEAAP